MALSGLRALARYCRGTLHVARRFQQRRKMRLSDHTPVDNVAGVLWLVLSVFPLYCTSPYMQGRCIPGRSRKLFPSGPRPAWIFLELATGLSVLFLSLVLPSRASHGHPRFPLRRCCRSAPGYSRVLCVGRRLRPGPIAVGGVRPGKGGRNGTLSCVTVIDQDVSAYC